MCRDSLVLDPDASPKPIEVDLVAMHRVGLIVLYDVGGKAFAEFVNCEEHNSTRKEVASRIKAPSGVEPALLRREPDRRGATPDNSGPTPGVSGLTPEVAGVTPEKDGATPEVDGVTPREDGPTLEDDGATPTGSGSTQDNVGVAQEEGAVTPPEIEVEGDVEGKEALSSPSGDGGEDPDARSTGEGNGKPQGSDALATRDRRSTRSRAGPTRDEVQQVVDVFNAHRGDLPAENTLSEPRGRKLVPLRPRGGRAEAVAMIGIAASEVAPEPWWQQHCYGIDNVITDQSLIAKAEAGHAHGTQLARVTFANSRYGLPVKAW